MRLLLDTHIALWATLNDGRFPDRAHELIESADEILVSIVSLWEVAIKWPLARAGRGAMPVSASEAAGLFAEAGYTLLGIAPAHAIAVEELPLLHADPFDRMIIAQARRELLRIVTRDRQFSAYGGAVTLV